MKKKSMLTSFCFRALIVAPLLLAGCSQEDDFRDVDGQKPSIVLTIDRVQTEAGREFTIRGTVEDKDGLRSIRLINGDLNLDKTIDLVTIYEEAVYKYDLAYKFKTLKTQTGDRFPVQIIVTDLGGRTEETTLLVTMDGDFTPPTFTSVPDAAITVLVKEKTRLNLRFEAQDDKALDYVLLSIPELDFTEKVMVDGKVLKYNNPIELPSDAAIYHLTVKAVDKFKFETVKTSVISVSEMPDFQKMYLTDVKDVSQLNSDLFGIPMLIERTAPYTYTARYYSEAAGSEVRFIPQKTDFSPICFGLHPNNHAVLTDEPEQSLPIVLPEKGYYEISFNVQTGSYTTRRYIPTDKPVEIGKEIYLNDSEKPAGTMKLEIGLIGSGLPGAGSWNPAEVLLLTQDKENPFILYAEMELEAATVIEFTISARHNWGWWIEPFWRFDNSGEMEYNVPNNGDNMKKVTVQKDGKYMFKFDTHLLRSIFYPIN